MRGKMMALMSVFTLELCLASGNRLAEILPYNAVYSAKYNGLPITAVKTLTQTSDSHFLEELRASGLMINLREASNYRVSDNGQLTPLDYQIDRSFMGIRRSEFQNFDWEEKNAHYQRGEKSSIAPIEIGVLDIPTQYMQLRRDLAVGAEKFEYSVISRGQHQTYRYEFVRHETLATPIGNLETIMMRRLRQNDTRVTNLWFAEDWHYLLVKLEQIENKKDYSMLLQEAEIGNKKVFTVNRSN
ncbi:MAG: DUF3108 domain-containing protein [Cellvibrionales bacterium TMED148]|nr:hypothetical protein [Porticoccaceae bacterium]RPG91777.1 MAG: DUF3108 domain-containing protein [Cellvibrionales bacterium TMED148]